MAQTFSGFLDAMKVFLVDVLVIIKASCARPLSYFEGLLVMLVGFKALLLAALLLSWLLPTARRWLRDRRKRRGVPVHLRARNVKRRAGPDRERRRSVLARLWTTDWAKVFRAVSMVLFIAYPTYVHVRWTLLCLPETPCLLSARALLGPWPRCLHCTYV
jgi:hypothetical protein